MASYADACSTATTKQAGGPEESVCASYESDMGERTVDELQRVRLAHEGMRLLLSSEVNQAQELFRTARYLGPELNAGYSFVQFVRALMTFEDDALDQAYKNLEATEKFCETGKKFSQLFTNSSQDKLSPHTKLYRKSIVADCLLFESIVVFLKQSVTSYVKGGYILRKAWKMYEKIFQETERLCSLPSPIAQVGQTSPTDKHVGRSVFDKEGQSAMSDDDTLEEGEEAVDTSEQFDTSITALGDSLASMHLGFGALEGESGDPDESPAPSNTQSDSLSSSSQDSASCQSTSCADAQLHDTPKESGDSCPSNQTVSHSSTHVNSSSHVDGVTIMHGGSNSAQVSSTASGTESTRTSNSRSGSEDNLLRAYSLTVGVDQPDLGTKRRKKRPQSGYFLPEVPSSFVQDLEHEDSRLRGAVYFGYGLMNVIMSLIPPKLMKLANLFGFHGSRRVGLQALEFACNSQDMKAPLARIGLLWYHTIVRPFFALDGEDESAGAEEAERLLAQSQELYPNSALFLYFKGKVMYLRCQLDDALQVYTAAAGLARSQREIEHIALYEKGWIHFLQLDYAQALPCYIRLKNETRWSACYYAYLSAVMTGIQGDLKQSRELFLQAAKLVKRKNNNLEKFCARRSNQYKKEVTVLMPLETRLMAVEVIYLWRALPFCSKATKEELVQILSMAVPPTAQPYHRALRSWLLGGILSSLKRTAEAERRLRETMQYESQVKQDKHIFSFALYELAMIHISKEEYVRARAMLDLAREQFSGYEFEARLNFKVHSAVSLLK